MSLDLDRKSRAQRNGGYAAYPNQYNSGFTKREAIALAVLPTLMIIGNEGTRGFDPHEVERFKQVCAEQAFVWADAFLLAGVKDG